MTEAWDAVIDLGPIQVGVEAETRPRDCQELMRRVNLKRRDGGMDRVILLLSDTRSNRTFMKAYGDLVRADLPISAADAMAAFRAGPDPGGDSVILL